MCNAWNHAPGCNCGWGGSGTGGGGGGWGGISSSLSSSLSYGEPETRQIFCWWCGALVYYHTNGYGDSVLFDSLGYPWQVHECWQKYKNEFRQSEIRTRINNLYPFISSFVEAPTSRNSFSEQIKGYIVDNHIFHSTPETFTFLVDGCPAGYRWVYLDVGDGQGRYFRFLIPSIFAHDYRNQSIIEIAGKWLNKGDKQILFATKISKISYPSGKVETKEITRAASIKSKSKAKQKNIGNDTKGQLLEIRRSLVEKPKLRSVQSRFAKGQPVPANSPTGSDPRISQQTSRRALALSMYQQGTSLQKIAKSLDIKAEAHVLQMILKAAIQAVKDSQQQPTEVAVANMLRTSVEALRKKFGHLYKIEPQGIKLKELGTS